MTGNSDVAAKLIRTAVNYADKADTQDDFESDESVFKPAYCTSQGLIILQRF